MQNLPTKKKNWHQQSRVKSWATKCWVRTSFRLCQQRHLCMFDACMHAYTIISYARLCVCMHTQDEVHAGTAAAPFARISRFVLFAPWTRKHLSNSSSFFVVDMSNFGPETTRILQRFELEVHFRIRHHTYTSAYVRESLRSTFIYVSIRQHTSAYVRSSFFVVDMSNLLY